MDGTPEEMLQIFRRSYPHQSLKSIKPVLCMCASMLLKLRNPHVNLVQGMVSIVLRVGHACKQVYM